MKKIISIIMVCVLVVGLMAGCGGNSNPKITDGASQKTTENGSANNQTKGEASETKGGETTPAAGEVELEAYTMGVLFNALGTQEDLMKSYLDNYVGPAFNVKFVYSEACDSAEKAVTFVENAYASGAQAILSFNTDSDIVISKCNELGMYIISNNNKVSDEAKVLPHNLGLVGTSVDSVAQSYGEIVKNLVSDGEKHNVIIVSGGAGIGNEQHKEVTMAILNTLQESYGLTYSQPVEEIATVTAKTEVETGSDVKVLIYPGYAGKDTYISEMSSILQTGEYDMLLSTYQVYTQFSVAVDEVEKAFGKNIIVASVAPLADATQKGFDTLDSTGDTSVNAVLVKPNSIIAMMFAAAYNALSGNADMLKDANGEVKRYECKMWVANNADEYKVVAGLDKDENSYAYTVDDLKQMIKVFNPELTQEKFIEWVEASDVEAVKTRRGIK